MTPWVFRLVTANVVVFFFQIAQPRITGELALVPAHIVEHPWTAVTYMFLHGSIQHIFFNMLGLWVFGPPVETRLGGRRFLQLYAVAGLTGALLSIATPNVPIVGASGAVYGVMLAFAWFWPRQQILLWGILGLEARWLVVLFTLTSLYGASTASQGGGIAHFAHLGGFIGAWGYLRWMESHTGSAMWKRKLAAAVTSPRSFGGDLERWKAIKPETLHPVNREEYDRVMAKVAAGGAGALTPSDREFLDRFSRVM
jgi:membrane associated rhomboid family serine protease